MSLARGCECEIESIVTVALLKFFLSSSACLNIKIVLWICLIYVYLGVGGRMGVSGFSGNSSELG